jgi:hypothetical protein
MTQYEKLESLIRPHLKNTKFGWQEVKVIQINGVFTITLFKDIARKDGSGEIRHYNSEKEIPVEDIVSLISYIEVNNRLPRKITNE